MITTTVQRWREKRDSYRPAGEIIRTADYEVAELEDDTTPKAFVERHHYSGSFPSARFRFGLYRGPELAGVAVFSHPCNDKVLTSVFKAPALAAVELGRFVLLDSVPGNGETWFLARAFELLRQRDLVGVVSFSDPMRRTSAAGVLVFGGHIGTIYQAFNARYLGRATARTLRLLPDGSVLHDYALQKIRKRSRGWVYAAAQLEAFGADPLQLRDPREWLAEWLPRLTRKVRHPGNHRYAWPLQRRYRRLMVDAPPLEYPKLLRAVA